MKSLGELWRQSEIGDFNAGYQLATAYVRKRMPSGSVLWDGNPNWGIFKSIYDRIVEQLNVRIAECGKWDDIVLLAKLYGYQLSEKRDGIRDKYESAILRLKALADEKSSGDLLRMAEVLYEAEDLYGAEYWDGSQYKYKNDALTYAEKAAELGNESAMRFIIEKSYSVIIDIAPNLGDSIDPFKTSRAKWIEYLADRGDVHCCYLRSHWDDGLRWLQAAAMGGSREACCSIGDYYLLEAEAKNSLAALDLASCWYAKGAALGGKMSAYNLASLFFDWEHPKLSWYPLNYRKGIAHKRNPNKAFKYLKSFREMSGGVWEQGGHSNEEVQALRMLRDCYEFGLGTVKSDKEAAEIRELLDEMQECESKEERHERYEMEYRQMVIANTCNEAEMEKLAVAGNMVACKWLMGHYGSLSDSSAELAKFWQSHLDGLIEHDVEPFSGCGYPDDSGRAPYSDVVIAESYDEELGQQYPSEGY